MRVFYHPKREEIQLSAVFYALSDPTRLHIVRRLLAGEEMSCKEFEMPGAKSTLSHHFKTLREAGVTATRPEGTLHMISLRHSDLEARFPGLLKTVECASEPL